MHTYIRPVDEAEEVQDGHGRYDHEINFPPESSLGLCVVHERRLAAANLSEDMAPLVHVKGRERVLLMAHTHPRCSSRTRPRRHAPRAWPGLPRAGACWAKPLASRWIQLSLIFRALWSIVVSADDVLANTRREGKLDLQEPQRSRPREQLFPFFMYWGRAASHPGSEQRVCQPESGGLVHLSTPGNKARQSPLPHWPEPNVGETWAPWGCLPKDAFPALEQKGGGRPRRLSPAKVEGCEQLKRA